MKRFNKFGLLFTSSISLISSSLTTLFLVPFVKEEKINNLIGDFKQEINWNNNNFVNKLIVDNQGLVYSNIKKEEIIAILPTSKTIDIVVPSSVKKITGYKDKTPLVGNESLENPILKGAFESNNKIQTIRFEGNNAISIGQRAFANINSLIEVDLPISIQHIGSYAFFNCVNLQKINLDNVITIGNNAFESAFKNTYRPNDFVSKITLSKLNFVGDSAFKDTLELKSVHFEKNISLNYIGISVFENSGISNTINLKNNMALERIDNFAFKNSKISQILLPTNLKKIGIGVFEESSLEFIDLSNTKIEILTKDSFKNCKKLSTVFLPKNSITTIETEVFLNCKLLTTIGTKEDLLVVNETSKKIEVNKKLIFPKSIKIVDVSSFRKTGIIEANLKNTKLVELPYNLFLECNNLTKVELPLCLENIKNSAFLNNVNLSQINFDELLNLKTIGAGNFVGSKLTVIDLSKNTKLTNINSNDVDPPSFSNIDGLTEVKLPTSLNTVVSNDMFTAKNTNDLNNPIVIGNIGYYDINGNLTVTNRVLNVGQTGTNLGYDRMQKVDLSSMKKLTKIVERTFSNNVNLKQVIFPSKALNWEFLSNLSYENSPFANNSNLDLITFKNFNKITSSDSITPGGGFNEIGNNTKNQVTNILNSFSFFDFSTRSNFTNLSEWDSNNNWIDVDKGTTDMWKNWYSDETLNNLLSNSGSLSSNTTIAYKKHNNVLWKYSSNNNSISITGDVNIYRTNKGTSNTNYQIAFNNNNINKKIQVNLEIV